MLVLTGVIWDMGILNTLLVSRAARDLRVLHVSLVAALVNGALTDARVTRHAEV